MLVDSRISIHDDAATMVVETLQKENSLIRHDWSQADAEAIYQLPLMDLIHQAQSTHRLFFDPNTIQLSTLLNIKDGGCPEDCAYCPQSARYQTEVKPNAMLSLEAVTEAAVQAKDNGATRFCMGAAWRNPRDKDFNLVLKMVDAVKELGLESCATLGMLSLDQAQSLQQAGLDFYNHNLDSSEEFYDHIITTRDYQDRLDTLENVRQAGLKVCCGGIVGMGESDADRAGLLATLANMKEHPESVPINMLVQVKGTPLADQAPLDPLVMVRTIATARIMMPRSYVRLSAGRSAMSDELQALCFQAGANSIFYGEKLLTTSNPQVEQDKQLFNRLGLRISR